MDETIFCCDLDQNIHATAYIDGGDSDSVEITITAPDDESNTGTGVVEFDYTTSEEDCGKKLSFVASADGFEDVTKHAYIVQVALKSIATLGNATQYQKVSPSVSKTWVTLSNAAILTIVPTGIPDLTLEKIPYDFTLKQWIKGTYYWINVDPDEPPTEHSGGGLEPMPDTEVTLDGNDITITSTDVPGWDAIPFNNMFGGVSIAVFANVFAMYRCKGAEGPYQTIGYDTWGWIGGITEYQEPYGGVSTATGSADSRPPFPPYGGDD